LPIQFADRLVSVIEKKEEKRDYYWLAVGILFSIVSLIVAVVLVAERWSINAFSFLSSNVGLVVFGVLFVALLQWIDKKVVRKQLESHKH
jgi:high-affinity K+ transport system ATPase subunit B